MNKQIGMVNYKVIELLDLNYKEELPIFLGDSNIEHMKKQHFEDYEKYGEDIKNIINNLNPYSDINVLSKTEKGKGDCMPAMEYLLSDIDHSHEVFLFPFEFFYRTDEIAVSAQEKIVPVITISYTPVLLFTKEGRFQNF